jgi:hypothetical protein
LDGLDRLTQRLLADLARPTEAAGPAAASDREACVGIDVLRRHAEGGLDSAAEARLEAHLDRCLVCLDRFVELRDCLHGLRAPAPASPSLRATLDTLLGDMARPTRGARMVEALRRALGIRVPAWAVAGLAAALVLVTWSATYVSQPASTPGQPPSVGSAPALERLDPARASVSHTLTGTVTSIREVTSEGVEAHVLVLRHASGATYVLFTWGPPTVSAGDALEADAIVTDATQVAGLPVYQGVATELRPVR